MVQAQVGPLNKEKKDLHENVGLFFFLKNIPIIISYKEHK